MISSLCQKHYKHVEAFCSEDFQLLCINCILHDGHKAHTFNAIPDATILEKNKFLQVQDRCQEQFQFYTNLNEQVTQHMEKIQQQSDQQQKDIGVFFKEIKQIVQNREQLLKQKVQEQLMKEQNYMRNICQQISQMIGRLTAYQNEVQLVNKGTDDIEFLGRSQKRQEILESLKQQVQSPDMKCRIPELLKEQETNLIIKQLLAIKVTPSQQVKTQKTSIYPSSCQQSKKQILPQNQKGQKEINLFKKKEPVPIQQKKQCDTVPKKPLGETNYSNIYLNTQQPPKNIISINISKKKESQNLGMNSITQKSFRLTNLQDARKYAKQELVNSVEYKSSNTPRKRERSQSKKKHNTSDISVQSGQENVQENPMKYTRQLSANRILGKQNEDSYKHEFGNFLNSHIYEVHDITKNDFSQLYHNMRFDFLTFGGFVEANVQVIEKYDPSYEKSSQYDLTCINRAKFGMTQLINGNILIMGGKQDGVRVSSCEEYSITDKRTVNSNIKLNYPKSGFGVVNYGELIYVIGGNDGTGSLNSVEIYDQQKKIWTKGPFMNEKRDELGVVLGLDYCIYAIGGFGGLNNQCLNTCERLDLQINKWENIPQMNCNRRALAVVSLPDGIYAIGGFNGTQYLNSVEKYDDQMDIWIEIAPLQYPRCTLSAIVTPDNQYIYVFGGFDNEPLDSVEKYNILSEQWELCPPLQSKRFMHQTIVVASQLISPISAKSPINQLNFST